MRLGHRVANAAGRFLQAHDVLGVARNVAIDTFGDRARYIADDDRAQLEYAFAEAMCTRSSFTRAVRVPGTGAQTDSHSAQRVGIAIDDFGTGHSSPSYCKRLPINVLKIDQLLMRELPGDCEDAAIVTTIINMARSRKLRCGQRA